MVAILIILEIIMVIILAVWHWLKIKYDEEPQADEIHTIRFDDGWRIKLYRRYNHDSPGEPVLLCHGLMGNPTNFQYPRGNAMVDTLVEQGFDCWMIDLRGNRHCEPPLGTSRYTATYDACLRDFPEVLKHIRSHAEQQRVHWIGHSMGGMLLYSYATVYGTDSLASGTTLGTPPGFANLKLKSMKPFVALINLVPFLADPFMRVMANLGPVFKISSPFAPINWDNISPDVNFFSMVEYAPPAVTRQMEEWGSTGTWTLKGSGIDMMEAMPKLDFPLHLIAGRLDPLAPVASIEKFHQSLASKDTRLTILGVEYGCEHDYNHVELVFSKNGKEEVYLPICDWLKEHAAGAPAKKRRPKKKATAKKKTATKKKTPAKPKAKTKAKRKSLP